MQDIAQSSSSTSIHFKLFSTRHFIYRVSSVPVSELRRKGAQPRLKKTERRKKTSEAPTILSTFHFHHSKFHFNFLWGDFQFLCEIILIGVALLKVLASLSDLSPPWKFGFIYLFNRAVKFLGLILILRCLFFVGIAN